MGVVNYTIVVVEEPDGQFSASAPELPGVFATGDSEEQARENLDDAIELYLLEMQSQ